MDLFSKIIEIVGDETKAKEVVSSLGEFMIPKEQYNKKVAELNNLKTEITSKSDELEQIKLSSMTEQDRLKHEFEKASNIQKEYSLKTNRLEAEKMFVKAGLPEDSYADIIDSLVNEDSERTQKVVGGVINVLSKERESAIAKTREEVINTTPSPTQSQSIQNETPVTKRYI
jgi:hypothetical protein